MSNPEAQDLIITDIFEKGLPPQVAGVKLDTMLSLMDRVAQAADEQLGLVPKPIEVEAKIIS